MSDEPQPSLYLFPTSGSHQVHCHVSFFGRLSTAAQEPVPDGVGSPRAVRRVTRHRTLFLTLGYGRLRVVLIQSLASQA